MESILGLSIGKHRPKMAKTKKYCALKNLHGIHVHV